MTTSIYTLSEEGSREVRYVGKSTNPESRLLAHVIHIPDGAHAPCKLKQEWINSAINRCIEIKMTIIETCNDAKANEREKFWINHYLSIGCNLVNSMHNPAYIRPPSLFRKTAKPIGEYTGKFSKGDKVWSESQGEEFYILGVFPLNDDPPCPYRCRKVKHHYHQIHWLKEPDLTLIAVPPDCLP